MAVVQPISREPTSVVGKAVLLTNLAALRRDGVCPLCAAEKVQVSVTLRSESKSDGATTRQMPIRTCIQCAYTLMQANRLGKVVFLDPLRKRGGRRKNAANK
jgi:hypothetical protein